MYIARCQFANSELQLIDWSGEGACNYPGNTGDNQQCNYQ